MRAVARRELGLRPPPYRGSARPRARPIRAVVEVEALQWPPWTACSSPGSTRSAATSLHSRAAASGEGQRALGEGVSDVGTRPTGGAVTTGAGRFRQPRRGPGGGPHATARHNLGQPSSRIFTQSHFAPASSACGTGRGWDPARRCSSVRECGSAWPHRSGTGLGRTGVGWRRASGEAPEPLAAGAEEVVDSSQEDVKECTAMGRRHGRRCGARPHRSPLAELLRALGRFRPLSGHRVRLRSDPPSSGEPDPPQARTAPCSDRLGHMVDAACGRATLYCRTSSAWSRRIARSHPADHLPWRMWRTLEDSAGPTGRRQGGPYPLTGCAGLRRRGQHPPGRRKATSPTRYRPRRCRLRCPERVWVQKRLAG